MGITPMSGLISAQMTTRTTEKRGNTTRTVIHLRDHEGKDRGTISYTQRAGSDGTRRKRLPYNFKEISAQITRAKTPGAALQVVGRARRRIGQLLRNKKNSEFDEAEIEAALLHAEQMERVARKHKKNLEIEERAAQGIEEGEQDRVLEEDEEEKGTDSIESAENIDESDAPVNGTALLADMTGEESGVYGSEEDPVSGLSEKDLEKMMRDLEQSISEMEKIEESTDEFMDTVDELSEALSGDMDADDLEEMKKKHRADEQRDMLRADMKYLRAMFDRLAREKAQVKAMGALAGLLPSARGTSAGTPGSQSLKGSRTAKGWGSGGGIGAGAMSTQIAGSYTDGVTPAMSSAGGGTIDLKA